MMGLLEAARRFSNGRGASSYASIRIRAACEIESSRGGAGTDSDVADYMGVSLPEYRRIVGEAHRCNMLQLTDHEAVQESPTGRLTDEVPGPLEELLSDVQRLALLEAIGRLPHNRSHGMTVCRIDSQ